MTLVLLLLVVMWVGAGVYYFRGRPEGRSADSIGSFHHQLRVLERTGPTVIDPAHSMRTNGLASLHFGTATLGRSMRSTVGAAASRRRQVQKRRRDVFFGLCLGVVGSFVLGWIPGLQVMWLLSAVLVVVLAVYVLLLVQLRSPPVAAPSKVRYLPEPGLPAEPAYLLRRSAN